jgi:hypothetical protein
MSKFLETFSEPLGMSDGSYALAQELYPTAEDALAEFRRFLEDDRVNYSPERLREDAVRFQFVDEFSRREWDAPAVWVTGAVGRGAKPVWMFRP